MIHLNITKGNLHLDSSPEEGCLIDQLKHYESNDKNEITSLDNTWNDDNSFHSLEIFHIMLKI